MEDTIYELDSSINELLYTLYPTNTYNKLKECFKLLDQYNVTADQILFEKLDNLEVPNSDLNAYIISFVKEAMCVTLKSVGISVTNDTDLNNIYWILIGYRDLYLLDAYAAMPVLDVLNNDELDTTGMFMQLIAIVTPLPETFMIDCLEYVTNTYIDGLRDKLTMDVEVKEDSETEVLLEYSPLLVKMVDINKNMKSTPIYKTIVTSSHIDTEIDEYLDILDYYINKYLKGKIELDLLATFIAVILHICDGDKLVNYKEYLEDNLFKDTLDIPTTEKIGNKVVKVLKELGEE